jgi:hypothetical protein
LPLKPIAVLGEIAYRYLIACIQARRLVALSTFKGK